MLVIVLGFIAYLSALFTVHQTQQAVVLQFGDPKRVETEPGLQGSCRSFRMSQYYEKRVLNLDPRRRAVVLADQKPLLVDAFVRYRITDPLQFIKTVRSRRATCAPSWLEPIINDKLRGVLGNVNFLASVLVRRSARA